MLRNQLFLPAPQILMKQEISIQYVSPMALAQKSQELQSIMRGLELFGSLAQTMPIIDYLSEDGLVKKVTEILGLPAKLIRSDNEVAQIRADRQAEQQAAMEQQQQLAETQMAKNAAPLAKVVQDGPKQTQ